MQALAPMQAVARVNAQVEAGNFYEAQQMYKTVYHRYRSRKQLPESYQILQVAAHWNAVPLPYVQLCTVSVRVAPNPAIVLNLQEGAAVQLRHGQLTCGIELGMLLVEVSTSAIAFAVPLPPSRQQLPQKQLQCCLPVAQFVPAY